MSALRQRNPDHEKDSFVHHEPTHASRELEEDDLVGEMSWGRFSGYLTCNVMLCGELVVVAGDYREYYHVHIDNETGTQLTTRI